jgi:uncharacterized protein YbaP (TraB family)
MKYLWQIFLIIVLFPAGLCAETMVLKSGVKVQGRIIEDTTDYIRMGIDENNILTFYRDEIQTIEEDAYDVPSQPVAVETQPRHFLWQIVSGRGKVYLFGSIHLGKPDMYPLNSVIEQAFEESDALVVEVDVESVPQLAAQQKFQERGLFLDGRHLQQVLTNETYELLEKRLADYQIPINNILVYKPWFTAIMLQMMQVVKLGFDPQYGVDAYFLKKAREKKDVLELESLDEQLSFLDAIADQDLFLRYTLEMLDETERLLDEFLKAWSSGDVELIEQIFIGDIVAEHPDAIPILKTILYDRNVGMANKIQGYLKDGRTYFVVVGAAHLIGDQSIIALLQNKGHRVDQL